MEQKKVRVKLLNSIIRGNPGQKFRAFGHDFEIQPDGSAVAEIHPDFVDIEVAAGRIEVIRDYMNEDEEAADEVVRVAPKKDPLIGFGHNSADCFGKKTLSSLKKEINGLLKSQIQDFAESRLRISLPSSMGKSKMITEVMHTAEALFNQIKEKKYEPEDE